MIINFQKLLERIALQSKLSPTCIINKRNRIHDQVGQPQFCYNPTLQKCFKQFLFCNNPSVTNLDLLSIFTF